MKKIISIVLALVLICSVFCVNAFAAGRIGDANGDGKLSALDARMILQHVAGVKTIEDTSNLDVSKDGKISAVDARVILQVVAGIVEDPITEEQFKMFVDSFNGVKENASSVTLVTVNVYESEPYSGPNEFKEDYEAMLQESIGEQVVNQTYTGVDIETSFPPVGATCNLTYADVKDFKVTETENYYEISFKVKGETNPTRGKGVGAVATIVTKEEVESSMKNEIDPNMSDEDFRKIMKAKSRYNDVTVKATIDKATGNMIEYYVDTPYVMEMNMAEILKMNIGIGTAEKWKIAY